MSDVPSAAQTVRTASRPFNGTTLLRHDCGVWRVSSRLAAIVWLIPIVVAGITMIADIDRSTYRFLTKEDGPLEWAQFGGFLVSGLAALCVAYLLARSSTHLPFVLYVLLGLGCLFVAGEEISWGQRVFGFDTPTNLNDVNLQGETTLHNVSQAHPLFRTMYLLIGLYGGVLVPLVRLWLHRHGRVVPSILNLVMPPLFLTSGFVVLFGYRLLRLIVFPEPRFVLVKYGEVAEFALAFVLAVFTILTYRRLRAPL